MNRAIIIREKVTRLVKLMVEKQIRVTQRGSNAFVEYDSTGRPRVVNIPYIPDEATEEYLNAIEGFLDHEVAHVLFSDYAALAKAKKGGVGRLHNIIEDAFIEKKMASQFAGSGLNLKNVGEFFLKTYTDVKLKEDPSNAVGLLLVPAIRAMSGQTVYIDYMNDKWHYLDAIMKKIGEYAKEALPKIASSDDGLAVALKFKELLDAPDEDEKAAGGEPEKDESHSGMKGGGEGDAGPSEEGEEEEEGDDDEAPADDSESDVVIDEDIHEEDHAHTPTGAGDEPETKPEEKKEVRPGKDGAGSMPAESDSEADPTPSSAPSSSEIESALSGKDFDAALSEILSERAKKEGKASDYMIYTKDLDVIEPMDINKGGSFNDAMLKAMQDTVDHMIGPLQKDLERAVAARSASSWSAGHRSGKLHSSTLARLTAFNDERVFRRKHVNTTKDVAVSLVIDCSGSMNRRKIQTAAYAAYGLSCVLDRMNINHEVLGFTTLRSIASEMRGEEAKSGVKYARSQSLYIPILKSFSERLGTESKKRFAALPEVRWLSENVDGESIQIAATRLMQCREQRKIMIVLSDGQPACPGDFVALQRHLKKVVLDIERQGVDVLGLGIMSDAPKHFYSKYTILNNVSDLPTSVIGEIKRLLMKS